MTAPNLGEDPNSALRDAVHIPVIPVWAQEELQPGDEVIVVAGDWARKCPRGAGAGVVDPFRKEPVPAYRKFWLFMRKIDGQPRHSWSSPDFPDELQAKYEEGLEDGQCCYGGG